jgi:hypothetical protein
MKLCEHIDYQPDKKEWTLTATLHVTKDSAYCEECKTPIDISPLKEGGQTIIGKGNPLTLTPEGDWLV